MGLKAGHDVMTAADRKQTHEKAMTGRKRIKTSEKRAENTFIFGASKVDGDAIRESAEKYPGMTAGQFCRMVVLWFCKTGQKI